MIETIFEDRTWLSMFTMNWQINQGIVCIPCTPCRKLRSKEITMVNFINLLALCCTTMEQITLHEQMNLLVHVFY